MSVSLLLALVALACAVLSFVIEGPMLALAVICLAVAHLAAGRTVP